MVGEVGLEQLLQFEGAGAGAATDGNGLEITFEVMGGRGFEIDRV